jgi:hypothetical protein
MWPFDDDADMVRRGRLTGGLLGRLLYKYANASLRLLAPSAYGDRRKLTKAIHRQYLEVFRERHARIEVLHALARAILESRSYYAEPVCASGSTAQYPGAHHLGHVRFFVGRLRLGSRIGSIRLAT